VLSERRARGEHIVSRSSFFDGTFYRSTTTRH
jgi:hypothetical protein